MVASVYQRYTLAFTVKISAMSVTIEHFCGLHRAASLSFHRPVSKALSIEKVLKLSGNTALRTLVLLENSINVCSLAPNSTLFSFGR